MSDLKINIEELESLGVADTYFSLLTFINGFVNKNFPLTRDDMIAITNDKITNNLIDRNFTKKIMQERMIKIIESEIVNNQRFVNDLFEKKDIKVINNEEWNKKIFDYKQNILEYLWNYNHHNGIKKR